MKAITHVDEFWSQAMKRG